MELSRLAAPGFSLSCGTSPPSTTFWESAPHPPSQWAPEGLRPAPRPDAPPLEPGALDPAEALDDEVRLEALKAASGDVPVEADEYGADRGRLVVSEPTARALIDHFPRLANPAHRELFVHSLVGQMLHTSTGRDGVERTRVEIPAELLSRFQGMYLEHRSRVYRGLTFLEMHREILPAFAWTGWKRGQYPRQIERSGVPDDVLQMIVDDLQVPVQDAGPLVDFRTLAAVADPRTGRAAGAARAGRAGRRARAGMAAARSPWPLQRLLLGLLNGARTNVLSRIVGANAPAAIEAAMDIEDPERRLRTLAALREIQLVPDTVYVPSRRLRTPRVFGSSVSPLGLPRDVRKALFSGCLELDLVGAQLACAASEWSVGPLMDHLRREGSVWPHLIATVAGTHSLADPEAKRGLKTGVYACVFGMSKPGIRSLLQKALSAEAAAAFIADPLVAALLVAREQALADLDAAGGITDCLGRHRALTAAPGTPQRKAECRSALAGTMQALELKLLEPVIVDAIRVSSHSRPDFRVICWLHDGLTISVSARGVEGRLVRLVAAQAERLGVPTFLEATWLGTAGYQGGAAVRPESRRRVSRVRATRSDAAEFAGTSGLNRLAVIEQATRPGGPDGKCWMWQRATDPDGYGRTRVDGRTVRAHRAAWEAANGCPVPPGLVVRHTCHTPACVNPEHLIAGTQAENIADRDAAGRTAKGERNGRSVLKERDVGEVRRMVAAGRSLRAVARQFGVNPATIRDIVIGRNWKSVV